MKRRLIAALMVTTTLCSWNALAVNPVAIKVDLDVDANYDNIISENSPDDEIEFTKGGFVRLNGMTNIILRKCASDDWTGKVELTWDSTKIVVATETDGEGGQIFSGTQFYNTALGPCGEINDPSRVLPQTIWVYGVETSKVPRDVEMMLTALHSTANVYDAITLTVIKFGLTAKDLSTYPENNSRMATAGETLYLVAEEELQAQKASITATPDGGLAFGAGEPIWAGQTSGNNGDATVEYSGGSGDAGSVLAKVWSGAISESVNIDIVGKNAATFSLIPGANTLKPILDALSGTKAFPGVSLTSEAKFTVGGSMWTVEKPNSPLTTKSYSGNLDLSGKLTGKIWAPPPWSGQFPPGWLPGDPWMLWQVYASASIGLTAEGRAQWLNEYNPSKGELDGSAKLAGDVEAGVYAVVQLPGYTLDGGLSASAGVQYNFTIEGTSPDKKLMGQWETKPVSLNGSIKCVRDSDGYIVFDFEASIDVWDGWKQMPKTVLIGQPANPAP